MSLLKYWLTLYRIRHIAQKLEDLNRLRTLSGNKIGLDDDMDNVIIMLWTEIGSDIRNFERVLREYKILAERSRDISWRRSIKKALRKMTWKQDMVQGYLDRLTSNVSELENNYERARGEPHAGNS